MQYINNLLERSNKPIHTNYFKPPILNEDKLPHNLNKYIPLIYELINNSDKSGIFKEYIIYSKSDAINKYNDYKSKNIHNRYDIGVNKDNVKLCCNLNTGLLYLANNINNEFTFYRWFKFM